MVFSKSRPSAASAAGLGGRVTSEEQAKWQ